MQVGSAIRAARTKKGLTLNQLAHQAGVDAGNLSRIERGLQSVGIEPLRAIARALGVTVDTLASDEQSRSDLTDVIHSSGRVRDSVTASVVGKDALPGRVPLVPWAKLGEWDDLTDRNLPGIQWYPISTAFPFGQAAGAVLSGDSMTQEGSPSFPDGTIIIIENRAARPGDFVVAKLPSGERTFKKLVEDAGVRYLEPLNRRYPLVRFDEGTIVGVLVEASTRLRFP
jgi:transcriptional regulator with XRE-family HTH domain